MQELKKIKSYTEPREGDENYDPGEEIQQERKQEKREAQRLEHEEAQYYPLSDLQTQQSRQSRQSFPPQQSRNSRQSFQPQRSQQSWRSRPQSHERNPEDAAPPSQPNDRDGYSQDASKQVRDDSEDTLAPEDTATPAEMPAVGELPLYETEYERSKRARQSREPEGEPSEELQQSRQQVQRQGTSESMKERKKKRLAFGLEPSARLKQHHDGAQKLLWSRIRSTLQEPFSEFLGVLVFTMIQQGGVAQATLSVGEQTAPGGNGFGPYLTVPFTTGIGVLVGVYIAGDSGSYLNPAITVANCLFRGLPWRVFPILTLAQILGAFVGTAISFGIYLPAINAYTPNGALFVPPTPGATANIFTSFPQSYSSTTSQVFSVVQRTAIMQCVISALKDDYNLGAQVSSGGSTNFPLNLFFLFFGITAALGWETAGQTNPALDLGARIMLSVVGYPSSIWTSNSGYPWIPVIMPVIGACFGAWLYDVFVFTGTSPVNSPFMGLKKLWSPMTDLQNRRQRYRQRKDPEVGQM